MTIQSPTETQDATGQPVVTWPTTFATVWANLTEPDPGREFERASRQTGDIGVRVEIRYLAGVVPRMRVVTESGRNLDIVSVGDPDGRRRRLVLWCKEENT